MAAVRIVVESAFGVLYAVGAVFQAVYTLGHGEKFYGAFLEGAWHEPARRILRTLVLPHAKAFTLALILFEAAVAILILTRGDLATLGLFAGAAFCVVAATVSSPGGTVGNLAMAAIQLALATTR